MLLWVSFSTRQWITITLDLETRHSVARHLDKTETRPSSAVHDTSTNRDTTVIGSTWHLDKQSHDCHQQYTAQYRVVRRHTHDCDWHCTDRDTIVVSEWHTKSTSAVHRVYHSTETRLSSVDGTVSKGTSPGQRQESRPSWAPCTQLSEKGALCLAYRVLHAVSTLTGTLNVTLTFDSHRQSHLQFRRPAINSLRQNSPKAKTWHTLKATLRGRRHTCPARAPLTDRLLLTLKTVSGQADFGTCWRERWRESNRWEKGARPRLP